ncbi:M23 family metallopeptidase [Chryseobacterium tructae]|uniref:M23 family metallopeptidase n=1 Tax=Chryseobacterium tructae TaxID=1037380 RepID=A0ABV7XVS4_9FLAO|nr:M23 family metallopeptidase [Chryseobacterium tructae]MDN3691621.1 M23 family metallopeptidase [Chryseobacterium tructae]
MINGSQNPIAGKDEIYTLTDYSLGLAYLDTNPKYTWYIKRLYRKEWIDITKKPQKTGLSVPFNFGPQVVGEKFLLEVYKETKNIFTQKNETHKMGELQIIPASGKVPKITKVVLFNRGAKDVNKASYTDKLVARAYCVGMFNKTINFHLWEDDAPGGGHNAEINKNNRINKAYPARVNGNGIAETEISLSADQNVMKQVANRFMMRGDTSEGAFHEFYVTASYDGKILNANQTNVDVANPDYKKPQPKPSTPQQPKPNTPQRANTPAPPQQENLLAKSINFIVDNVMKTFTIEKTKSPSMVKVQPKPNILTTCLCKEQYIDLVWGEKVNCDFRKKVVEICQALWPNNYMDMASGLMAVMYVETSGSFKAHQIMGKSLGDVNSITKDDFWLIKKDKKTGKEISRSSRAVGLIQFTQAALQAIGEFTSGTGFDKLHEVKLRFAKMGEVNQLDYVKKYFEPSKDKIKSPEDIYLHVFAPKGVGKADSYVLYENGTEEYRQNSSVDTKSKGKYKNDGNIQRSEILERYHSSYDDGEKNKPATFNCNNNATPPINNPTLCPSDSSQCFEYADVISNPKINDQSNNANKNRFHRDKRYNSTYPDGYYHTGTDILSGGKFVEIHSLLCGEVVDTVTSFSSQEYRKNSMGNTITIKSKDKEGKDVWIIYCHLDSVKVKAGQKVKHGEAIGVSGCTGNAGLKPNGTRGIEIRYWHVHIEASRENKFFGSKKRIDAEQFMKTKFDETTKGNPIK